jgi:hypothetical protein
MNIGMAIADKPVRNQGLTNSIVIARFEGKTIIDIE